MAVSIDLLNFYHELFERSCDAINAMAAALHSFYKQRGFIMVNKQVCISTSAFSLFILTHLKGNVLQDAFRRSLGNAVQWHDNLRLRIEKTIDSAVEASDTYITQMKTQPITSDSPTSSASDPRLTNAEEAHNSIQTPTVLGPTHRPNESLTPGRCARILQQRCPACFGGNSFGRSFNE
jgi:hypothetical protein